MRSDGNWSARIRLEFRPEIEAIGLSQKPTARRQLPEANCRKPTAGSQLRIGFYSFVRLIGLGSTNTPSP
jgi:hypothetical protein